MSVGFALLLFASAAASDKFVAATNTAPPTEAQVAPSSYDSYTQAYRAAKQAKKPMLVILNPAKGAKVSLISLEDVQKTRVRRDLLQNYVVAVIDTSTPHGQEGPMPCSDRPSFPTLPSSTMRRRFRSTRPVRRSMDRCGIRF